MSDIPSSIRMRITTASIAAIAWFALLLQLYLEFMRAITNGLAISEIVVNYFSFFTILTNLLVALALTFPLIMPKSRWGQFFTSAVMQAGIAVYIAVVGATYSLLLRHLWNPTGAQKLADVLLHDVVPVAYVAYWLIFVPKATLRWKSALLWLIYPVAYMVYTLIHGVATGWYPYPFIDVGVLGFPRAMGNAALMLLVFLGFGLIAVVIGRWMKRKSPNIS